jgi:hypothetical protein
MCTIYSGVDAIRGMIEHDAPDLERTLERVRGMAEWGVKATLLTPAAAGGARGGASEPASSGTEYLARRRRARDEREQGREAAERTLAQLHARLAAASAATVLNRAQSRELTGSDAEMVLNGSYLVPRDAGDAFGALFDELAAAVAADGLALELTGPWPPYHFVAAPEDERRG